MAKMPVSALKKPRRIGIGRRCDDAKSAGFGFGGDGSRRVKSLAGNDGKMGLIKELLARKPQTARKHWTSIYHLKEMQPVLVKTGFRYQPAG